MTEDYPPPSPQWTEPLPPAPEAQGTSDVIKNQAADLGSNTVDARKHTAGVAREQASEVAAEASRQGRDLLEQAQGQLAEQAAQGQQRLASELRSVGDELRSMAESSEQGGTASELARQIASRAQDAGQWLEARGPAEVVSEVQAFARRRPGLFLAVAAGVGLVAGRLTRGIKDASSDHGSPAGSAWPTATGEADVPPARYPGQAGYPTVGAQEATPRLSAPNTGLSAPATGLPAGGEGSWTAEETSVEETYIQSEPLVLLSEVAEDLSTLMRQEVALAKAEIRLSAKRAGKGAAWLTGAGLSGWMVLLFVSIAGEAQGGRRPVGDHRSEGQGHGHCLPIRLRHQLHRGRQVVGGPGRGARHGLRRPGQGVRRPVPGASAGVG